MDREHLVIGSEKYISGCFPDIWTTTS